jgi:hypothetical protein
MSRDIKNKKENEIAHIDMLFVVKKKFGGADRHWAFNEG